ncbi:PEP-CTERM sorting domain-containing protein [Cyanothece sp. BG0011]|uniref:PEP-CTERM sorting domain-containing protein n=1 Tax=Cyanothece sp. BG0011 TaxID=2082950 RepID=UPI0018E55815|nr:PEP-CTERM sorting domain-containing protein [Cyanothece sp. BG0011]
MVKISKLVTLTTGIGLGLGFFSNQEAIAATLGPDFAGKSIEKISLIVNEHKDEDEDYRPILSQSSSNSTDYDLALQLKVSFLDEEQQPGEGTWFINRRGSFDDVGSYLGFIVHFCESSDPSSVCYSLFGNRFIRINNERIELNNTNNMDTQFSRIKDDPQFSLNSNIIDLLTNGENNNVRLETYLMLGDNGTIPGLSFQQSSSESIFFVSTPPAEPAVVPEPLTLLGSATAIGFGSFFKGKLRKNKSASKKESRVG